METSRSRRGSSAGSSSLEVRCACQYYRSDSLLPERSALAAQHKHHHILHGARMVQTPPAGRKSMPVRCGDHDYEPIGQPTIRVSVRERTMSMRLVAPVVKITDTDVIPVGDSDDSIDDRYRFQSRALILDGDVILPLDGRIEDNVMDGKNMGDQTMDDEIESPQEFQDRLEERFQTATPIGGSRTDVKIQASRVDSPSKSPEPKDTVGQRLKSSAGRLRSRFKNIQKPTFMKTRPRSNSAEKSASISQPKTPPSPRSHQKASRMERFRMALPERPKFSLPDKSKFQLPDKSKFHIDTSKFHIKKPNIQMPKSLSRTPKRSASQRETKPREESHPSETASTKSGRRNIFDFSTLPRPKIFDRKAKAKAEVDAEYVTSSPKESRAQSTESSTFPRAKKSSQSLSAKWATRFGETIKGFHHEESAVPPLDRSEPWRHPSLEKPRLSLKPQVSSEGSEVRLPWESTERRYSAEDEAEDVSYGERMDDKDLSLPIHNGESIRDPRLSDERLMQQIGTEERKKKVTLVEDIDGSAVDLEGEDEHVTYHPKELGAFQPVDPREFRDPTPIRAPSVELSEDEESMRSDRENQQSSGSSCERRRRGVIEEIDSDEFFLREKGISQENMRFHIMNEIRDALRPRIDDEPPIPPKRTRSMRKRKEESLESFDVSLPPEKPKREQSLRRSQMSLDRTNSVSSSRHRIVYQTETPIQRDKAEFLAGEPLDSIVVVKPERRKSRSSLRSQSIILPEEEPNILSAPMQQGPDSHVGINAQDIEEMLERQRRVQHLDMPTTRPAPPAVPTRRKRLRRDQSSSLSIRTNDSALCNGFGDSGSHERIPPPTPPPTPPPDAGISQRDIDDMIQRQLRIQRLDELDYIIPEPLQPPVPPKRTRSRTASLAPEDDRTSHGAESLPGDFAYADEDIPTIPRDSSSREPSLPGYAVIEKREKPPRPPPPRRKRGKFATAPRPSKVGPKRPARTYSTLRPAKSDMIRKSTESMPFMDADYSLEQDEPDFHKDLRRDDVLIKIQTRPLPAPPRPPRRRRDYHQRQATPITRRSLPREITPDFSETVASTQTDPLPDDLVIEEEITTAKLVVTPSRSGSLSQVMISTESERVPSPTGGSFKSVTSGTPPIPPLPVGGSVSERDGDRVHAADTGKSDRREPPSSDSKRQIDMSQLELLRTALFSTDEPLRIPSLEVGDLKVDRLTVSQLEAYKVAASEIDAIVVSATEMTGRTETEAIHPSLLQELIAIRNQLQAVAASQPQSRPQSAMEDASTATSNERIDIPFEIERRPATTERRPITRESSPLLIVQPPTSEQEATGEKGRTLLPCSGSMTDIPSTTSDSITASGSASTVVAVEALDEVTIITTEPPSDEPPTTTSTESLVTSTATTTAVAATATSRSSSPSRAPTGAVRQTASPVKSLPPVISVTPDAIIIPPPPSSSVITTNNTSEQSPSAHLTQVESSGAQPQRAVISYRSSYEDIPQQKHTPQSRETTPSPPPPRQSTPTATTTTQFIAFPTSQIPPEFFNLASGVGGHPTSTTQRTTIEVEPSIADMTGQLLRALGQAGSRSLRHFVDSVVSRFATTDAVDATTTTKRQPIAIADETKLRRVELAICALLILIVGLIVVCVCMPRTVTHHHHWDYFNPPQ